MPLALNLDELATRLTGVEPVGADPQAWAYALREAVSLARPAVLLTGWSIRAETTALTEIVADAEDPVDALYDAAPLEQIPVVARALETVRTLAGLYPGGPRIAPVLRGPCSQASALGAGDEEAADVIGDLLAALSTAYVAAGAGLIVVREDLVPFDEGPLGPLMRALGHHDMRPIVIADRGGSGPDESHVASWQPDAPASAFATADAGLWTADDATFAKAAATLYSANGLVVVPDSLPNDTPLERLGRKG